MTTTNRYSEDITISLSYGLGLSQYRISYKAYDASTKSINDQKNKLPKEFRQS